MCVTLRDGNCWVQSCWHTCCWKIKLNLGEEAGFPALSTEDLFRTLRRLVARADAEQISKRASILVRSRHGFLKLPCWRVQHSEPNKSALSGLLFLIFTEMSSSPCDATAAELSLPPNQASQVPPKMYYQDITQKSSILTGKKGKRILTKYKRQNKGKFLTNSYCYKNLINVN